MTTILFGVFMCIVGLAAMTVASVVAGGVVLIGSEIGEQKVKLETGSRVLFRIGVAMFLIGVACVLAGAIIAFGIVVVRAIGGTP